jgi:NADH-quinone oxidoreductase subunit G
VLRIMPRNNDDVSEEWISDKTRFVWDGLKTQRLDRPYIREKGKLRPASWGEAFDAIANKVEATESAKIGAIAGDLATAEEIFALKDLMTRLGVTNIDCRQEGAALNPLGGRASYIFNPGIAGLDQADAILLIGSNPRWEAPVLNARIRKAWRLNGAKIGVIGEQADLTYKYDYLGAGGDTLGKLRDGKGDFAKVLEDAKRPIVIVGQGALKGENGGDVLAAAAAIAEKSGALSADWNGFAVLHTAASRVAGLDLGFVPGERGLDVAGMLRGKLDVLFLLGADEVEVPAGAFVVYQGTHGDRGAHRADVILPGAAYTEKSGTYVNTEGRVQIGNRAVFPPGDARDDWAILRALSDVLDVRLPYDSLPELRGTLYKAYPHFAAVDRVLAGDAASLTKIASAKGKLPAGLSFKSTVESFYFSNPIARASALMAECAQIASGRLEAAE